MSGSETPKKDSGKSRKRKNTSTAEAVDDAEQNQHWSLDEKQRFVTGVRSHILSFIYC